MAEIVGDCPRCGAEKTTFDLKTTHLTAQQYNWQWYMEGHVICRHCRRGSIFVLAQKHIEMESTVREGLHKQEGNVNGFVEVKDYVSLRHEGGAEAPDHLPAQIEAAFEEGTSCLAIGCPNAAATMFRLAIDLGTRAMLPAEDVDGPNSRTRRDLGLRLPWMFEHGLLPEALQDLSTAVKEDGNEGAHAGTLTTDEATDLLDFAMALLTRLYTEPERLRLAKVKRDERRSSRT